MHKLDPSIDLAEAESQNRNFDELLKHFRSFDSSKQLTDFMDNFLNSRTDQINALVEYLFKYDNPNLETHFSYYGRNKLRVLSKYFSNTIKAKKRKSSFCARMKGMPGPMKDSKGRPTRKAM